jgi:hypothetical protein
MRARLLVASLFAATVATVASACTDPVEDELASEDTTEISDAKADEGGTYTYYTIARDLRRCVSPLCGGYWVARVNRTTTKCVDGSYAAQCYVADLDWARLGLGDRALEAVQANGSLVLRGTVAKQSWPGFGIMGRFKPSEAWLGQGPGTTDGVFVKISETGVRCFAAPCNSMRETKLNGSGNALLAELGWDSSGASDDRIGAGIEAMFGHDLIIAGDRYTVRGPGGTAKARTVEQFWIRAEDDASAP